MKRVIIESPFSAKKQDGSWDAEAVEKNLEYVRACMADCFKQGESPFASHALYTQPGVLNDQIPEDRKLGMEGGFAWNEVADYTVVYVDRGFSQGMKDGILNAIKAQRPIEVRSLYNDQDAVNSILWYIHEQRMAPALKAKQEAMRILWQPIT